MRVEDCVGEGWLSLVDTFRRLVDWDVANNAMPPVQITQVKEKFGTLRIYYVGGNDRTAAYVRFAETLSESTCEECGSKAKPASYDGWIRTVCHNCT